MKIFRCTNCEAKIAKEEKVLEFGDTLATMYKKIVSLQGHEEGDPTKCRQCGLSFARDIVVAELWNEEGDGLN